MKDFERLRLICIDEVLQAGIHPGNITKWKINKRLRQVWGKCILYPNGECEIQIASRLLEDERISDEACKSTIIHEILHSCPECKNGHRGKWSEYAARMNQMYGYNIKRVTTGEEKGVENYVPQKRTVKYVYVCTGCGQQITFTRKCKFTRRYRQYMCTLCGKAGGFERVL